MIKLGLLGNNISKSEMPNLITKLGNEFGFDVKYELFDQASKTNFNFKKLNIKNERYVEYLSFSINNFFIKLLFYNAY